MRKVYDDWERLVEAVLRREKLRQLCYEHSRTPSQSSSGSSSRLDDDAGSRSSSLPLQMAIIRLQEELICTLTRNKQCFDHGYMSLPTREKDFVYEESTDLVKRYSVQNASARQSSSRETEEYVLDLLHPDMIPQIKSIGSIMFASHHDPEFCQAFVGFGRGVFAVCLTFLNVEDLSIEKVQMGWDGLCSRIRKWCVAIKKFIGLHLANAKHLFDEVLGQYGHISLRCLNEASKASLTCFLSFGCAVAVAVGPHQPERLFCLLDMYKDLAALIPNVEALFPEDIGSCIRVEFYDLLARLGHSAKTILMEFRDCIFFSSSSIPFGGGGGIHPLSRYVMNYILCLAEYDCTLNLLLQEKDGEDLNDGRDTDLEQGISGPLAAYLQSWTLGLEASMDNMSNLYGDNSLKHIFMMNNIHYMVEKIRNSKIKAYFGDERIKIYIRKFQFHAVSYQRNTWSSILVLLRRDERADRAILKARCREFTLAFENVYKKETGWYVPDPHLREELRISTSITVVCAYRDFFIKNTHAIGDKHMKYTDHELEIYISDLLEGSPKSLRASGKGQEDLKKILAENLCLRNSLKCR